MTRSPEPPVLRCPAPAKLNLFLHVTGRRIDGHHELETVFRFLDFGDQVSFRVRTDGQLLRLAGPAGIAPGEDLVVRAARALQEAAGTSLGADLWVEKRTPVGGGLGGGSSDAATTLMALNRLWGLGLGRARLMELGLQLGADVPVFVGGRSAFARGVGERLTPVSLEPAWYLVLTPPVQVSTASVFADPELTRDSIPLTIRTFSSGPGRNDLEGVVCRRHPEVAEYLDWLRHQGPAAMTGAGACVFAAFPSEVQAQAALSRLRAGMSGFVAKGVDDHPLLDWTKDSPPE